LLIDWHIKEQAMEAWQSGSGCRAPIPGQQLADTIDRMVGCPYPDIAQIGPVSNGARHALPSGWDVSGGQTYAVHDHIPLNDPLHCFYVVSPHCLVLVLNRGAGECLSFGQQ
jgi:hypothetical protein